MILYSALGVPPASCWLMPRAGSWCIYMLKESPAQPRFRQYLQAIASRLKPDRRIKDAEDNLGDLDKLDEELRRYAIRLQLSLR